MIDGGGGDGVGGAGLLVTGTARLAVALYAASLAVRWRVAGRAGVRAARALYSGGCAVFLLHVLLAFALVHHFSHDAAYAATARRTAEVAGIEWGGGLYANYVFTVVWSGDVLFWWWGGLDRYEARRPLWGRALHGFLLFMAINAAVVFVEGAGRWFGLLVFTALALAAWRHVRRPPAP